MAWYLAPSLEVLRGEVNACWPNRDKTSDGTIGDEAHQGTSSDHNPNARGSVNAWDMDKDGVDVDEVIRAFQEHPSAHYWIWDREIADADNGWRRQAYGGENAHTEHAHFSIRQTATAEQDGRSWGVGDMALTDQDIDKIITAWIMRSMASGSLGETKPLGDWLKGGRGAQLDVADLEAKVDALSVTLAGVVEQLDTLIAAGGSPETTAILAGVRDIVATGLETGAQGVRGA